MNNIPAPNITTSLIGEDVVAIYRAHILLDIPSIIILNINKYILILNPTKHLCILVPAPNLVSSWLRAGSYFHHLVDAGSGFHSYWNSQIFKIVEERKFVEKKIWFLRVKRMTKSFENYVLRITNLNPFLHPFWQIRITCVVQI